MVALALPAPAADREHMLVWDLSAGGARIGSRNLVVRYVLYAPGSGDVTTQGRLYFTADGARITNGRVLVPYSGRRGGAGHTMEEAGQKIAEYVMDALGVPAVPTIPRR